MKSPKLESADNDCFSGLDKPSDSLQSLHFFFLVFVFLFTYSNKIKKGKGKKRTNRAIPC